jgi:hypothetical protein
VAGGPDRLALAGHPAEDLVDVGAVYHLPFQFYAKEGSLYTPWVMETGCGDAKAIAVSAPA